MKLPIREHSLAYISKLVAASENERDGLSDEAVAERVSALVAKQRCHFDLLASSVIAPDGAKKRGDLLDTANRIASAVAPSKVAQRTKLTERERAWIAKHGTSTALDIANGAPLFEDETNHDE